MPNRLAYTPEHEHMGLQLRQHFHTHIDPSCSLHKATNHILHWIGSAKTMVPKKGQKCGSTESLWLDKPVLGQGAGGGGGVVPLGALPLGGRGVSVSCCM